MDVFTKQPSETIDYVIDFSAAVNTGDNLVSSPVPTISLVMVSGTGTAPTLGFLTVNTTANSIKQRISGGVDGQVCLLTAIVTTASGEVLEGEVKLKVKEIS